MDFAKLQAMIEVRYIYEGEVGYETFALEWVSDITGKSPDALQAGDTFCINEIFYTITKQFAKIRR